MVDGCNSQAFCIAKARVETNFNPSSNDKTPAETKAENSPNEWPATISGLNLSPKTLAKITECKKMAGWVTLVCFSSSSEPVNIISVIQNPKISLAKLKYSWAK